MTLTAESVKKSIMEWPSIYQDKDGNKYWAMPVSEVPKQLRDTGWKNVPRLNHYDFKKMGLKVVEARYIQGARPKRYCDVVVAANYPELT
jgi:hypothetical protein